MDWGEFVNNHPDSTFFHQLGYKEVIEKVFGFKARYIYTKDAILPLFEGNNKLISVPFSTQGGILYKSEESKNQLLNKAKEIAKDFNYLELRQEKDIKTNLLKKDYYYHMKLELKDPILLWNDFDRKLRNAIRKAEKSEIKIDKGHNYLDDFYKIFSINIRDLGTPVDSKLFFQELIKTFPNKTDIYVAKLKDQVIGALFLIKHKKTIKAEWASSLRKYFGYNASQLLYWYAIQDATKEFEIFDFGRSMKDEGTYLFKKKFNAQPVQLHYKYYKKMPDIRKTNWKRRIFAKTWSKLPITITNKLGPIIRRRFP